MLKLYFLRHGQTEYNVMMHVQGWNDSPLTELGIYQAKCAGYGARNIVFTHAYSGDCGRQIETAKTFMSQNLHPIEIIPDMHFREMSYGGFENGSYQDMLGKLYEDVGAEFDGYDGLYRYYDAIQIGAKIEENDKSGKFEGNEKATKRILEGISILAQKHPNGDILISTSSYIIALLIHHLFPDIPQDSLVGNGSLTIIGHQNGKFEMLSYNDLSYRQDGEKHFRNE